MQDVKRTDQLAGREIAGRETTGREFLRQQDMQCAPREQQD